MLADLVGHIVSSIVGEAVGEWLFPGTSTPQPPPQEGEWNASLGSVAAFLATLAALFCGLAVLGMLRGMTDAFLLLPLVGAIMLATLSGVLARRALEVTERRRALARLGAWLSRTTIWIGLVAAALVVAGVSVGSLQD